MQIEYKLIPYPNQEGEWLISANQKFNKKTDISVDWQGNKIIAHTLQIHPLIPLIRREQLIFPDNVEKLARDFYWKRDPNKFVAENSRPDLVIGYTEGYKAHAETHPFTLEMAKSIWEAAINWHTDTDDFPMAESKSKSEPYFDEFIQSLQQPKKEYVIELTTVGHSEWGTHNYSLIPSIDKEGYINILSIKH